MHRTNVAGMSPAPVINRALEIQPLLPILIIAGCPRSRIVPYRWDTVPRVTATSLLQRGNHKLLHGRFDVGQRSPKHELNLEQKFLLLVLLEKVSASIL